MLKCTFISIKEPELSCCDVPEGGHHFRPRKNVNCTNQGACQMYCMACCTSQFLSLQDFLDCTLQTLVPAYILNESLCLQKKHLEAIVKQKLILGNIQNLC